MSRSERFPKPIPELSYGPIWDFRKLAVETFGVQLRPDDILLWAPADKRIYIRSSPDTVNFLAGMLGPEFGLTWIELEFVLSEVTKGKAEPVFRFKIHTKTGMRSETSFSEKDSGISSAKVGAEAIIGPDGEQIDLNAAVNFKSATRSFDFTGSCSLKKDTETTIWETEDKASDAIYRCTVKPSIFFEDVSIKMQPGPARINC